MYLKITPPNQWKYLHLFLLYIYVYIYSKLHLFHNYLMSVFKYIYMYIKIYFTLKDLHVIMTKFFISFQFQLFTIYLYLCVYKTGPIPILVEYSWFSFLV